MRSNLYNFCKIIFSSARSSARIERWPPEPKVTGSNPVGRALYCGFAMDLSIDLDYLRLNWIIICIHIDI